MESTSVGSLPKVGFLAAASDTGVAYMCCAPATVILSAMTSPSEADDAAYNALASGDHAAALSFFASAVQLHQQNGSAHGRTYALLELELANCLVRSGDNAAALLTYDAALSSLSSLSDAFDEELIKSSALGQNSRATLLLYFGRTSECLLAHEKELAFSESHGYTEGTIDALIALASCYRFTDQTDRGLDCVRRAEALCDAVADASAAASAGTATPLDRRRLQLLDQKVSLLSDVGRLREALACSEKHP